jgi:hypothetical protein
MRLIQTEMNSEATTFRYALLLCTFFAAVAFGAPLRAQEAVEKEAAEKDPIATEAVENAKKALNSGPRKVWYDSANDDVRGVKMDPAAPPPTPPATAGGAGRGTTTDDSAFRVFAWIMLGVLLLFIVWIIVRAILNREREELGDGAKLQPIGKLAASARLDQLPVNLEPDVSDLLGRARWLSGQGRYNEAIVYFYAHVLVKLDQLQLIELAKGKTNRQYLREISAHAGLRPFFMQTMRTFEDSFFGGHEPDDEKCRAVIDGWPEFESQLPKGAYV